MKQNRSIQIKATFLLLVFSFNIVVGFACGLGVNMGFNSHEQENKKGVSKIHEHADGKNMYTEPKLESTNMLIKSITMKKVVAAQTEL